MELKAVTVAAFKPPPVVRSEATTPVPVLPRAVDAVVIVIAAGVVTYPDSTVDMRGIGVIGLVAEVTALVVIAMIITVSTIRSRLMVIAVIRRGAASRGRMHLMFLAAPVLVLLQSERRHACHQ